MTTINMSEKQIATATKAIATLLLPKNRSNMSESKLFAACFDLAPPHYSAAELERLPKILSANCVSLLIGSQWLGKYPKEASASFIATKILSRVIVEPLDKLFFINSDVHDDDDITLYSKVSDSIIRSYCQ